MPPQNTHLKQKLDATDQKLIQDIKRLTKYTFSYVGFPGYILLEA
jgi:hypothetical protein